MPMKKVFINLGVQGNGAHGLVVVCDACRGRGPDAGTQEGAMVRARRDGFTAVKHRQGTRDVLLWICRGCFAAWPVRLRVTEFIEQKRRKKGGRR